MTLALPACETLLLEPADQALHVTLNRPEVRNALNARMWEELDRVFAAIEAEPSIKVVVLRGAGGVFCAGGDISERSALREAACGDARQGEDRVAQRNRRAGEIFSRIDRAPQAVVAVVEGFALGGGFGLACVADVTLASADARFALPEVTLGLCPGQILPFLLRRVGPAEVRRMALTAARIDAEEALRLGIVHRVAEAPPQLDEALARTLRQLGRAGPQAIARAKRLIESAQTMEQEALLDLAARTIADLVRSPEGVEGAAAFRQKRPPRWQTQGAS